ncbi:hypothetical protein [Nostoc sp. FACHB-110]|uniref:hypothetical protein n=1 Tax=Nostoc sp. FACHB-110 TaxID=2692834 RepID=UPI001683BEED|nr:hypothetical protein [Nostoc sp. FACHB-110]MBD2436086.1 hypothetical protein [Nostoc sp. FACHB-110]
MRLPKAQGVDNSSYPVVVSVPRPALEASVPSLVELFDGVEDTKVRNEWQKAAIAALCLILVVDARQRDRASIAA